ncbi:MAG: PAS domain S-box protein [Promethearchaeota archaeon]
MQSEKKHELLKRELMEQQQRISELENRLSDYELILDQIPAYIFYKDLNDKNILANQHLADSLQLKKEEIIGKTSSELFPAEQAKEMRKDDLKVYSSGKPKLNIEEPWDTPEGTRWGLTSKIPRYDENGKIIGLIGFGIDITQQKKLENELKESEEKFRSLVENSPDIITMVDSTGEFQYVNKTLPDLSIEGVIGKTLYDFLPEEFHEIHREKLIKAFQTGQVTNLEVTRRGPDNTLSWYSSRIVPIKRNGNVVSVIMTTTDVTKRMNLEINLKRSEEWLSTALRSIGDAVIATEKSGKVLFVNPVAETLTGWKEKEAVGKPLEEVFNIINEDTRKHVENPVSKVLREGILVGMANHTVLISKNRSEIPIADSGAPIRDVRGEITGVVLIFRDITERRKAENKLKKSLKENEILLQEVHHRVRNNLQIISSLINLQLNKNQNSKFKQMCLNIKNRILVMALIHERLYSSNNFSEIEFKKYITVLTEGLFDSYGINSERVKINLDIEHVRFKIDTAITCGLIINELVSNSLIHAFSKEQIGEIIISLRIIEGKKVELIIRDNGVGLPDSFKLEKSETLGLQLVENLVKNQLNGDVKVIQNKGTEFRISFERKGKNSVE